MKTEHIADLAAKAARRHGLDNVSVGVTPADGVDGMVAVRLSFQVRSVCPVCARSTPDVESAKQHRSCGAWSGTVSASAEALDPGREDFENSLDVLADALAQVVALTERDLRAEARERAQELHQQAIEALCRGDYYAIHEEPPPDGDYTMVVGGSLATCAEVHANTVRPWDTENVITPISGLPQAAQETINWSPEVEA
jgi:hypothetical protein